MTSRYNFIGINTEKYYIDRIAKIKKEQAEIEETIRIEEGIRLADEKRIIDEIESIQRQIKVFEFKLKLMSKYKLN